MFGFGAQGRGTTNGSQRAASTSAPVRKVASATSFGDDLSDLFGGTRLLSLPNVALVLWI